MHNNFRDENENTALLEFKLRFKADNLNNREHIDRFEKDMDKYKVEYKSWENPHTGAYWVNGVVTNRFGIVWQKVLEFFKRIM